MSKKFNCPSCSVPMENKGGASLFQNCDSCGAPIVMPSRISEQDRDKVIESTVGMPPESVMKAESMSRIYDHLDKQESRVEELKESGEVIDPILEDSKSHIDNVIRHSEQEISYENISLELSAPAESEQLIAQKIQEALNSGRKIEAVKIYREHFNTSLVDAKDAIEALERG